MTNNEFSDQFDVLLNSHAIVAEMGDPASKTEVVLDEYEKSVFLTQAQEDIVISLYNGKNPFGESFERTEELRRYLSNLVSDDTISPETGGCDGKVSSKSVFFTLPNDLWFITYEALNVSDGKCGDTTLDIIPVTQDEYHKIKRNPFRGSTARRALRLDLSNGMIEVVSDYTATSYYVRYLRKPCPIILTDLPEELSINGQNEETSCELHDALHKRILEEAVTRALRSRGALKESK